MERYITQELIRWKSKLRRKPLLLTGVRQCGKTYILNEFGKNHFEDVAYFNFEGSEALAAVFEYDFDVERIVDELGSVIRGKKIVPGETLVIFDEIQSCPRAITSLKYFCENMRELHIVAAGSLLGVALRSGNTSFPVGKVDRMNMYPMTFEEFVAADQGGNFLEGIKKLGIEREISSIYTRPMEKYLKLYYIVGGMPEVVQMWVDTHDFKQVEELQDSILMDYSDDFIKHAPLSEHAKLQMIWKSIPAQLARDNNKFVFSHVKKGARSKDLEDALEWLTGAGLVYKLHLTSTPELPLSGNLDATYFKVYMADVGLLRRKSGVNYRTILEGDNENYILFKGALAENYVLTELTAMGLDACFWRSKANAELDFLTEYEGLVIPIECKSAANTKAKSLSVFCGRYRPKIAFKVSLKNVGDNMDKATHIWSLPLYCLFRIKEYIHSEWNQNEIEMN